MENSEKPATYCLLLLTRKEIVEVVRKLPLEFPPQKNQPGPSIARVLSPVTNTEWGEGS